MCLAVDEIAHDFRIELIELIAEQDNEQDDPDDDHAVHVHVHDHVDSGLRLDGIGRRGRDVAGPGHQDSDERAGDASADFVADRATGENQTFLTDMEFPLAVLDDVAEEAEDDRVQGGQNRCRG